MKRSLKDRLVIGLNRILPKDRRKIVFCSFPDYSDNAYAVYAYIVAHPEQYATFKPVWLLNDPKAVNLPTGKAVKKRSFKGILEYCRAGMVFHTHGTFGNCPVKGQTQVSLWHGMPLKTIMELDATHADFPPFEFDLTVATSPLFQDVMSRAFGCDTADCPVTGLPRNDLLFESKPLTAILDEPIPEHDRMVLWMPTYRQGIIGDVRVDGKPMQDGIGFMTPDELSELNVYLEQNRTLMLIKVHPMQDLTPFEGLSYSHIRILSSLDAPLYHLVGQADALLTDYSSVYIDYLLLDRPIGFVVDDLEEYGDSRGFVFDDPQAVMPGKFIYNKEDLYAFLQNLMDGKDGYADKRQAVAQRFHTYTDNRSCERLFKELGL